MAQVFVCLPVPLWQQSLRLRGCQALQSYSQTAAPALGTSLLQRWAELAFPSGRRNTCSSQPGVGTG